MKAKDLSAYFSRMGKRAAKVRLEKLSPAERKEIASNAAQARWSGHKKKAKAKRKPKGQSNR